MAKKEILDKRTFQFKGYKSDGETKDLGFTIPTCLNCDDIVAAMVEDRAKPIAADLKTYGFEITTSAKNG